MSEIWTPELMIEANECLHEVLTKNPEGTFDELLENIVRSIAASRDEIDVDSLTENVSFSEIINPVLLVGVEDWSDGLMGAIYSTYQVYQLANDKFAVLYVDSETQIYSVLPFEESLAAACKTIGTQGLSECGTHGNVTFDPGGEVDPWSVVGNDQTFWSELIEINSNKTSETDKQDEDSQQP